MLISDAYSWSPNNILEVVVIPYYGYICSDDDDPNHYVFNHHPYGVVDLDAYFWASPYEPNNFNTGAIIIMNGLEVNDDYGGCQEDPGEPNSVVRRQDYYLDY